MAPGRSLITARDAEQIAQVKRDVLATRILRDPFSVVITRIHATTGAPSTLPAQMVAIRVETTAPVGVGVTETATTNLIRGRLQKESPFDVKVNDRFLLPDGWTATVTLVDVSEETDIVTAYFTANTGYGR